MIKLAEQKLKILELTEFTAGTCGVWTRVFSESKEFVKRGHEVIIFSSDYEKGTGRHLKKSYVRMKEGVELRRFVSKDSKLTDNVKYWFNMQALKEVENYDPDIIITHLLHPHSAAISVFAGRLRKRNPNLKIYLVPHSPFNVKRNPLLSILTGLYRRAGLLRLSSFDKVIAIAKWEVPYLLRLGCRVEQIEIIPNGLPEEFFNIQKTNAQKDVLYFGRIAEIKSLETLLKACRKVPQLNFSIVGTAEPEYLSKLQEMSDGLKNVTFYPPIYELAEKIRLIDEHKIFVLPSKWEGLPNALLEAMARGRLIISSNVTGSQELIRHRHNGLTFEVGNDEQLAGLLMRYAQGNEDLQRNAIEEARSYSWDVLIKKYDGLFAGREAFHSEVKY
ncbi:MAG: glycosyltransferase family 4 protein [Candidatus Omnitrophica bacterium]|nr:glycosyltransferase family 4 protein [Candidatus Omnitrophota bacterium]MCB9748223.1 glycosyltransferase family 4 protein [Candidatus Omnitrophota bacterium]